MEFTIKKSDEWKAVEIKLYQVPGFSKYMVKNILKEISDQAEKIQRKQIIEAGRSLTGPEMGEIIRFVCDQAINSIHNARKTDNSDYQKMIEDHDRYQKLKNNILSKEDIELEDILNRIAQILEREFLVAEGHFNRKLNDTDRRAIIDMVMDSALNNFPE
jgi:hypothetical protein